MNIKDSKFITSVADKKNFIKSPLSEIAFVGRSNVGKSSLINAITKNSKLAKTSSTPGRTRLVNYFLINGGFYFVDLPGYGYHKASKKDEKVWTGLIEDYLTTSPNLKLCFVLVDSRIEPTVQDKQMVEYLYYFQIPFAIIATKSDKLSKMQLQKNLKMIANSLKLTTNNITPFSSVDLSNSQNILDIIESVLNI